MGRIGWLGHSVFEIELVNIILLMASWLTSDLLVNTKAPEIEKVTVVCGTQDNRDHLGDAIENF